MLWGGTPLCIGATAFALLCAESAHAYTIDSPFTTDCHERISEDALRAIRALGLAPPIPPRSRDEFALLDDLPFSIPGDMQDVGSAALIFGVRRPDILDHAVVDISNLPQVHGDPALQSDHCLRSSADDDPGGTLSAIAACQASARTWIEQAAVGLSADGSINADSYDTIKVTLPVRSKTDIRLSRFYVNAGTALHVLQDAFTHTFRDASQERVTTFLNWVDYVGDIGRENRDGPEHRAELDECVNIDLRRRERLTAATNASVELLFALLQGEPAERVDAAAGVVARATAVDSSCTFDNRWCASADSRYATTTSCAQSGGSPWRLLIVVLVLGRFTWGKKCASTKRRLPP